MLLEGEGDVEVSRLISGADNTGLIIKRMQCQLKSLIKLRHWLKSVFT